MDSTDRHVEINIYIYKGTTRNEDGQFCNIIVWTKGTIGIKSRQVERQVNRQVDRQIDRTQIDR